VQLILSEADAVMRVRPNLVIASQQLTESLAATPTRAPDKTSAAFAWLQPTH
jgi:hypothetical protein